MNTSPDSSWFYSENQEKKGPVSFSRLKDLLSNQLPLDTLVWTEGMDQWVKASSIPELSSGASPSDGNNPYAPPSVDSSLPNTDSSTELGDIPREPIPLEIGFCIGQGWNFTTRNLGRLLLLWSTLAILSFLVSFILGQIAASVEGVQATRVVTNPDGTTTIEVTGGGPLTILCDLISGVFSLFLGLGSLRYGHRLVKGETPDLQDLFSQGSKLLTAFGASFLVGLAVAVGMVFLIIPGIYLALRLGFFQHAIVEKNLGMIDSIKYSFALTKGNALSIFGLYIVGMLITLVGLIALVIGLFWAIPTVWLSSIIAFRFLHRGPNGIQTAS